MKANMAHPKTNYFRSPGGGVIPLSINKSTITKLIPVFATRNQKQKPKTKSKKAQHSKKS